MDECARGTLRSSESEGGCFGGLRRRNEGYDGRKPVEASLAISADIQMYNIVQTTCRRIVPSDRDANSGDGEPGEGSGKGMGMAEQPCRSMI